jgi:hypothetical protein
MRIRIQLMNLDADPGYQNDADSYGSGPTTLLL